MFIDTGEFAAIRDRADSVDAIAADVAEIRLKFRSLEFNRLVAFAEGAAHEAERALLRAQRGPGRHVRPRGERPGHLRLVSGGGR